MQWSMMVASPGHSYTVSTLLVVVSSQHLTLTNTCLVIMMENRKFFFDAIVLNRRANIFNERKYFSVISLLPRLRAVPQAAGGAQQKAGGGRRRQETAGGGQVARCHVSRSDDRKLHSRCCRCVATLGNTHLTLLHSSH